MKQLCRDFHEFTSQAIKSTFKDHHFYAPSYFAFANLVASNKQPERLKTPRVVDQTGQVAVRGRKRTEVNELGQEVGEPAMIDELEREVAWVKRKLGQSLAVDYRLTTQTDTNPGLVRSE